MNMANGQCIQNCTTGFSYNSTSGKCEKNSSADICLPTQTTISGKCYDPCATGYFMDMSNGQCIQNCTTGFSYNATSGKCEKNSSADKCLPTQTTISGKCYDPCSTGYFMDMSNGQCIQNCTTGFSYNTTSRKCEKNTAADKCLSTQTTISGKCYDPCSSGYFMDSYGQCIQNCATGFSYNATSGKCDKNSSADKCLSTQTTISGKCYDPCPTSYFMDMTNGQCIQNCATGFSYNAISGKCENISSANKCLSTQTTISGKCYDPCPSGYFMDMATGQCIQNCSTGFSYNATTGKCESTQVQSVNCPINTTLINNKCYKNCVNSIMDINGNCITCPDTYTYNSIKNMCVK
jgi:hypothetical protein